MNWKLKEEGIQSIDSTLGRENQKILKGSLSMAENMFDEEALLADNLSNKVVESTKISLLWVNTNSNNLP